MYRHIMHIACAFALSILSFVGAAQAVSLGKIDVASHLGEPFYAEIPLGLDDGESIANVFVSLASASDYRLLEVFRDAAVDNIKVNIKRDERGERAELTSLRPLDLPFFNIIIKVKQGRATHFKKFSVFLDLPKSSPSYQHSAPKETPKAQVKQAVISSKPTISHTAPAITPSKVEVQSPVNRDQQWARTQRYGPMVFGDTITTVAQRLRVDQRFSNQQVMLALFEKNKSKFEQNNINLIKAGTYLDVPTADEVMLHSDAEAARILRQHAKAWKKLTQQRRYAKVAEAQKNRYTKHVSIGEHASGVAKHAIADAPKQLDIANKTPMPVKKGADKGVSQLATKGVTKVASKESSTVVENATIALLKKENDELKQRLSALETKLSHPPALSPEDAASVEQVKKLQIQLARQNGALQRARQELLAQQEEAGGFDLLTWILIAVVTLLAVLVGYLVYMLKGQRRHPVQQEETTQVDDLSEPKHSDGFDAPSFDDSDIRAEQPSAPADAFDSIPDLTDEDTSEMEAFQNPEEEPDPNVDYLSEADVYARYGMDDEAEKQINMALRLRDDNKDAHVKRVELRHKRGDQAGVQEAVEAAKLALSGSALAMFMETYEALGGEQASDGVGNEESVSSSTEAVEAEGDTFDLPDLSDTDNQDDSGALDLDGEDWSADALDLSSSLPESDASDEENDDDGLDFSGFEMPSMDDALSSEPSSFVDDNIDDIAGDDGTGELDLSDLALPDLGDDHDSSLLDVSGEASNKVESEHISTVTMDASNDLNLDDISLTDFDTDTSDALSVSEDSLDESALDVADDENDATVIMDASDDLNLDDISLTDFDTDTSDALSVSEDSLDEPVLDVAGDDTGATVNMDVSDDLNLDDISLTDFDTDSSDALSVSEDSLDESSSDETDENDATVIMEASDDLNLDDISLTDSDINESDLPLESAGNNAQDKQLLTTFSELGLDEFDKGVGLSDEQQVTSNLDEGNESDAQLLTAFSELDLGEFDKVDALPNDELPSDASTDSGDVDYLIQDVDDGLEEISSPDLDDFDDLEIDLDAVDHDTDLEEFTSTIQATLKELGVEDDDFDEHHDDDPVHDLDADLDESFNLDDFDEGKDQASGGFDESLELDNLLSELDNYSK